MSAIFRIRNLLSLAMLVPLLACQSSAEFTPLSKSTPIQLSLAKIYKEHQFSSDKIGKIRWLADSSGYTSIEPSAIIKTDENGQKVTIGNDIVVYNPNTLTRKILVSAAQLTPKNSTKPLTIDDYHWSTDQHKLLIYTNSKKVWRSKSRGDYWLLNLLTNQLHQLGGNNVSPSSLMFAKFSPDATQVAYVRNNNIYVEQLANQHITQLTRDAGNGIINGLFDWVYEEEFGIRDGFRWSPDGKNIAYWQLDTRGSKDFILINNTDSLYPTLKKFPYPKVGETNALAKIGIVNLQTQKTTWATLPHNSRNMYVPRMDWSMRNNEILIQHLNRKQDTDHLYLTNIATGASTEILTERDAKFLDNITDVQWFDHGNSFIWPSERNGWRNLYRVSRDGKTLLNLTPGNFDAITKLAIDEQHGWLYFIAAPDNVSQRYLYRSKLDASIVNQRVTPKQFTGFNSYQMSANGQWAIQRFSRFDQPEQIRLIKIAGHQVQKVLMDNHQLIAKLAKLPQLAKTEFFKVNAQDGVVLDGYIMRPANFNPHKKYPVIFYVYGEAWGQTVQDKWRGNSYLWDQLMTQHGFIIASIDNRGTRAPKGRTWRKSIYGAVGVLSSRDQSDALTAMAKRWSYIDTEHIGIWGHSGGGSMTLNMLFRYPNQYQVGIAIAPVADQRLYDTIYQERYSGLLPDYAESYRIGSPITYAKNLTGKLLLVHGTGDDNVHY